MTKTEAAKALGRSVRTLQRLAQQGELTVISQLGPNGRRRSVFDPAEIEQLRARLDSPNQLMRQPSMPMPIVTASTTSTMTADMAQIISARLDRLTVAIETAVLAGLPVLTIGQASTLTGLPEQDLLRAIKKDRLRAIKTSAGPRILRNDLDKFLKKL